MGKPNWTGTLRPWGGRRKGAGRPALPPDQRRPRTLRQLRQRLFDLLEVVPASEQVAMSELVSRIFFEVLDAAAYFAATRRRLEGQAGREVLKRLRAGEFGENPPEEQLDQVFRARIEELDAERLQAIRKRLGIKRP